MVFSRRPHQDWVDSACWGDVVRDIITCIVLLHLERISLSPELGISTYAILAGETCEQDELEPEQVCKSSILCE